MSVTIDGIAFNRRVEALQAALPTFGIDALATVLGKGDAETQGVLTSVLHVWLLGYPFANTAIIVNANAVAIITSQKQAKHLEPLASDSVQIVVRPKEAEEARPIFSQQLIALAQGTVGVLGDEPVSPIASVWASVFGEFSPAPRNVASEFYELLLQKDGEQLELVTLAANASKGVMTQIFTDEMTTIIDDGRKVTHVALSQKLEKVIDNERSMRKLKLGPQFDWQNLDWDHPTIIKSGNFSSTSEMNDERLKAGVIYCELGLKYKFYASNIGRTYLIDATKEQEEKYTTLVALQKHVLGYLKAGATCRSVYEAAAAFLAEKDSSLSLGPSLGHSIGIAREQGLDITATNEAALKPNEVLVLRLALDVDNYSLCLVDTIQITEDEPLVLTDSPRNRSDIAYSLQNEEQRRPTTRQLRVDPREKSNQKLLQHQVDLKRQLQEKGSAKWSGKAALETEEVLEFRKYESYKRETQLPQIKDLRIALDTQAQTIILPVQGRPVPFHINTYKNGSKTEENDHVYLRLNFNSPDVATGKNAMPFENPNATFVKSLTIRSRNVERVNEVFKKITDMKKEAVRREVERKTLKDVVQQDTLVEAKDRRPLRLDNLYVRPAPEGKRQPGFIEIHKNGIRYQSPSSRDQKVEVLFSNVDQLFFQPSKQELVVIIHFHLKAPIMVGKRKTMDVQFYRDATDVGYDDTGNRKRRYRYGDEEEIEQEQEERAMRIALDKEFRQFAEQIAKASEKLEVDVPFRELGFYGVPHHTNVFIQPTTECLVQLVDTPFLVIRLAEIEVAHFERIQFGLQEFDLVFVYKDYTKPVTHITTIPISQLDAVKDWLNEMDIAFYEGPLNLQWSAIMKTIAGDPSGFYANGGWEFLSLEDEAEDEQIEEESEFEDDAVSESDFDDDDDEEEDFSAESDAPSEEEESGPDWDELEEEAARDDEMAEREQEAGGGGGGARRGRKSKGRR